MGIDLNPQTHILMGQPQPLEWAQRVPQEALDQAITQAEHDLLIEDNQDQTSVLTIAADLKNPQKYKTDKPVYLSVDAGGRTVFIDMARLNKVHLLLALDKATQEIETNRVQGVSTADFQQRLIEIAAHIRGA